MAFNSIAFLVFLGGVLLLWPLVRLNAQTRWWSIVIASLLFYAFWSWAFVFLLLGTGLLDFWLAAAMLKRPAWKRPLLVASIVANLGVLFVFKYANWAFSHFSGPDGQAAWTPLRNVVLPLGISFYTFQSMSYTIDVYRGVLRKLPSQPQFLASLSFFAHLVAGPIIRAHQLLPQLETPGEYSRESRSDGLRMMVNGFFMKLVVADNLAPIVDRAFSSPAARTGEGAGFWWCATALFALQIYADFAGYSRIALGIARWMGYRFPENFRHPYAAIDAREFWQRWHMTLSTWFRDYLYIPLGGSRRGPLRRLFNLWFTMLSSALWHGPNWTFVLWGAIHASYLTLGRAFGGEKPALTRRAAWPAIASRALGWMATIGVVLFAWVFFRAKSIEQALQIVRRMLFVWNADLNGLGGVDHPVKWVFIFGFVAWELAAAVANIAGLPPRSSRYAAPAGPLIVVVGILCAVFLRGPSGSFIYFQF